MHKLLVGDSTWVHPVPTQCVCTLHLAHYFSSTWNGTDFAFFLVQSYYFEYIDKLEVTQDMGLKLGSSTYKFNNLGESLEQTIPIHLLFKNGDNKNICLLKHGEK